MIVQQSYNIDMSLISKHILADNSLEHGIVRPADASDAAGESIGREVKEVRLRDVARNGDSLCVNHGRGVEASKGELAEPKRATQQLNKNWVS